MRIEKIILDNFRCFEHKEIHFHPQFNVIIGENGLGKTAVTDAIAYLLKPFSSIAKAVALEINEADIRRVRFGRTEEVSSENTKLSIFLNNVWENSLSWIIEQNISMQYNSKEELIQGKYREIFYDIEGNPYIKKLPCIAYYPANRTTPITSKIPEGELAPNGSRFIGYDKALENQDINIKLITARIKTLDYEIFNLSKDAESEPSLQTELHAVSSELHAITQAMINCIPNCKKVSFSSQWNELMILFENGERKPFSILSQGFRNMISIVGDIAYRCARLNPNLNENILTKTEGIVIIDEIDLHVHPNWQRNIVGNLKKTFPKIQFIVTTHSPFIVQSLKKEELINLQENGAELETDLYNLGLEDTSEIMNVEGMPKSIHFREMVATAEEYYNLIASGGNGKTQEEIIRLGNKLNALEESYSDDAAFVALLKAERKTKGL